MESIIAARFQLFNEVYWHKTARAVAAMLKRAFWTATANERVDQEEFDMVATGYDEREFLMWLAEKLDPQLRENLVTGALGLFHIRNIYKRLRNYSSVYGVDSEEIYNTITRKFERQNYSHVVDLSKRLVEELNQIGKSHRPEWIELHDHHVLVDIPTKVHDSWHRVIVTYPHTIGGRKQLELSHISKMSSQISESLNEFTKKVRIYCWPAVEEQLVGLGSKFDDVVRAILK